MAQIGTKLRSATSNNGQHQRLMHWCPGCDEVHGITIKSSLGPKWQFNGDYERPTFNPSVLLQSNHDGEKRLPAGQMRTECHYFIRDGRIEFCGDSPHKLAGQTVDLPDWPYAPSTYGGIDE
ncbi:hypothetical protein AB7M45_007780 [Bradyrhizobium elkanii]|uniref:DUF6527 family protein n=1 Tax=Bradyrhizobium elkanii TaxID=29448 RepID=UPI000915BF55|nr:DUF6527 family protein [Bradyrhizobium elkanii]MCW2195009.1 hypothetical protein [Bradyrhizobium elkanii]NWL67295.1 ammonia monooxygenase [Bradyrhizobium elkanii]OIM94659.1 hypothetical protein BLN97_09310 [Bradyrhizobium elkanii]